MIKGADKITDFPEQFNALESEVKKLSENTRSIKFATWLNAGAAITMAVVAVLAFLR